MTDLSKDDVKAVGKAVGLDIKDPDVPRYGYSGQEAGAGRQESEGRSHHQAINRN